MEKPNIYSYLKYRSYLSDWCDFQKDNDSTFSFRKLSQHAELTSPNAIQWIIQGKRHLTSSTLLPLAKAMELSELETDYFELLIFFESSKSHLEKDRFYKKIVKFPGFAAYNPIDKSYYKYFEHWYNSVIYELVVHSQFDNNSSWIAQRIFPRISLSQIEASMNLLKKLNLIKWNQERKKWEHTQEIIKTKPEVEYLISAKYHQQFIQLGLDSLDQIKPQERDIRGVTLKVSPALYPELKKKLTRFWEELLEFSVLQGESEHVYQMNLQLFPLTKFSGEKK